MSLDKYKKKIRAMSDKDLHKLERRLDRAQSGACFVGSPGSLAGTAACAGAFGPIGLLVGLGVIGATGASIVSIDNRLRVIHDEVDRRHRIRSEKRKRLSRELKLHGKSKLKKMM